MRKYISLYLTIFALITLISTEQIYAYSFTGKKICSYYVDWRWGGSITTVHKSAFQQALTDWNGVQSVRRFRAGTNAPGVLDSYSTELPEYGLTNIQYNTETNCVVAWASKINTKRNTNTFTLARSTGNHELGHTLGLDHTNNSAVMNVNRDRSAIYVPKTDDINGVNALY